MLDRSVPYYPVIMTLPAGDRPQPEVLLDQAEKLLPEGYRLVRWQPGMEQAWCTIEKEAGEFPTVEEAMTRFQWEFLPEPALLRERMWFALSPEGTAVGTATLWTGGYLGGMLPLLHWVAVQPGHRRRGLARSLVLAALSCAKADELVFLTSQTWNWPAVRLYRQLGFQPWLSCPAGWEDNWNPKEAWRIISQKAGFTR